LSFWAGVTQLVECNLAKVDVEQGPSPEAPPGTFLDFLSYPVTGDQTMLTFVLWCLLFLLCWPIALFALVLYPIVWLVLLPFRIVGIAVGGVLELVWALITLPARMVRRIA